MSNEYQENIAACINHSAASHCYRWRHLGAAGKSRALQPPLDWLIRKRMRKLASIKIIDRCRMTGLLTCDDGVGVIGIRCRFSRNRDEQKIFGDLVVDTSGRFSRTPQWLGDIGYNKPDETVVDPYLGYASRLYQARNIPVTADYSVQSGCKALVLQGKPPDHTRGGVLLPVEGNRWHVTLAGVGKDYPPTDASHYHEFARTLRSNILYDAIKDARPLTPISGARNTNNRRRHYEKLRRWPERFMILGDSVCVFNPVFAQGISAAALQVMVLDQCLREHTNYRETTNGLAQHFQQQVTSVIKTPWLMATTDDLRWPKTEGRHQGMSRHLVLRYLDSVFALATKYPEVDDILARVAHLIKPANTLLHPRIALRVVARMLNPFAMPK